VGQTGDLKNHLAEVMIYTLVVSDCAKNAQNFVAPVIPGTDVW